MWSSTEFVLLDSNERRTVFLQVAIDRLGVAGRVRVVRGRAEVIGHDDAHRGTYDLVVARGFGPPAVVAECAAPLLRVGGLLVTSEPPGDVERWDDQGLARLGLVGDGFIATPYRYHRCRLTEPCPATYPRRVGVPARRPLWAVA
jgi:16S rRNA (guanine527-N7)-methyltransferase